MSAPDITGANPGPGRVSPILVVVPCLNEATQIRQLCEWLLSTAARLPLRIVVADGGSSDGTQEIVAELAQTNDCLALLDNPARLQGPAVNLAVERMGAGREFLIRIDAHADYPLDYCDALIEEATKTAADSVVVAMNTLGRGFFQRAVAAAQNSLLGNGGSAHRNATDGRWVEHGHHALMRVGTFRRLGGYDESFSHNEDAELDHRIRLAGGRIWLTGKTRLDYYPRSTPMGLFRQYLGYGGGRARNVLKHRTLPRVRQALPLLVAPAAGLVVLTPFAAIAALPIATWAFLCLLVGFTGGLKARDLASACSGIPAMIMHAGWSLGFWRGLLSRG